MPQASVRRAFTLIELLVVIAIIALLAAILFPVFGRARENSRRAACMSNLKQIGLGIMQYVQDFDERMPNHGSPTNVSVGDAIIDFMNTSSTGSGYGYPWAPNFLYGIFPYTKSTQILVCPSTVATTTSPYTPTTQSADSYYGNGVVLRPRGLAVASIAGSANVVLMDESNNFSNLCLVRPAVNSTWGCGAQYIYWHNNAGTTEATETYMNNHFIGSNFLYCDGHVKWKRVIAVTAADFGLAAGTTGQPTDTVINPGTNCYTSSIP